MKEAILEMFIKVLTFPFRKKEKKPESKEPKNFIETMAEYAQALGAALFLAIVIRGFLVEPFKIPSESMVPTLLVGDHIFVSRYSYGLRVPFTKTWLTEFDDPERGDVVVFSYPEDEDVDFIKRIVGIPGDVVSMRNGVLYINHKIVPMTDVLLDGKNKDNPCHMNIDSKNSNVPQDLLPFPFYRNLRNFQPKVASLENGPQHYVQKSLTMPMVSDFEITVPPRQYYVLGDNRDQSQDSRFWGFVPRENLKGKARFIWLSLNSEGQKCPGDLGVLHVRWDRFGRGIW